MKTQTKPDHSRQTQRLADCASTMEVARDELYVAVREARDSGLTLRAIADAVGLTHSTVQGWLTAMAKEDHPAGKKVAA